MYACFLQFKTRSSDDDFCRQKGPPVDGDVTIVTTTIPDDGETCTNTDEGSGTCVKKRRRGRPSADKNIVRYARDMSVSFRNFPLRAAAIRIYVSRTDFVFVIRNRFVFLRPGRRRARTDLPIFAHGPSRQLGSLAGDCLRGNPILELYILKLFRLLREVISRHGLKPDGSASTGRRAFQLRLGTRFRDGIIITFNVHTRPA